MSDFGYCEGERCGRDGCDGLIELEPVNDCSCHINPPCSAHENADMHCQECGWRAADDPLCVREIHTIRLDLSGAGVFFDRKPRVLDNTKIDWTWEPHTNSSMIKKGVFPPGTTPAQVEAVVKGTFGGRFVSFREESGTFKYIAYTD